MKHNKHAACDFILSHTVVNVFRESDQKFALSGQIMRRGVIFTDYISTALPESVMVSGIVKVLLHTFSGVASGKGESHDFPEIQYINKGRHNVVVDGVEYTLNAGQMILYPPNAYHTSSKHYGAEASIISFRADTKALEPIFNKTITLTPSQKQTFLQIIEAGLNCFRKRRGTEIQTKKGGMVLKDTADERTLQRLKKQLEFFLIDLCSEVVKDQNSKNKWDMEFEKLVSFLNDNITQNLTLDDIAEECGMSVSKLKLLFRETSAGGPIDYFIGLKVNKAKEMIREGTLNLSQIAEALGFSSLHYFSRLFKKKTGLSPSEYMKSK